MCDSNDDEFSDECEAMAKRTDGFGRASGLRHAAALIMEDAKNVFERGDEDGYADRLRLIATNIRKLATTLEDETRELPGA